MKTVAEIGINHNADMEVTKKLIQIAALAGFNYVKFQKRNPDDSTPESMKAQEKITPFGTMTYLEYKKHMEFGKEEYDIINNICTESNIEFFASVWDLESARFMKQYTTIVKIPSAHLTNLELLEYCRNNYGFRILSTGMSDEQMIEAAVEVFKPSVIMHTNSCYPSPNDELCLGYIKHLKEKYFPRIYIGYSGHEVNLQPTLTAVTLGAEWIERHITLDRHMWGSDQLSSVEPEGMFKLIKAIENVRETLNGNHARMIYKSEKQKQESLRKKDYLEVK